MAKLRAIVVPALAILGLASTGTPASARWSIGVHLGLPVYYRPYAAYYPYYPYRPVYIAPAPVIVPAPIVVQPLPAVQPVYRVSPQPSAMTTLDASQAEIDRNLQLLVDPKEQVRAVSALQLGRLQAHRAIDPLAATLAGDRSASVREAAARALGLIGSAKALPALQQAAVGDNDRDVRHSAQFAIEVVRVGR